MSTRAIGNIIIGVSISPRQRKFILITASSTGLFMAAGILSGGIFTLLSVLSTQNFVASGGVYLFIYSGSLEVIGTLLSIATGSIILCNLQFKKNKPFTLPEEKRTPPPLTKKENKIDTSPIDPPKIILPYPIKENIINKPPEEPPRKTPRTLKYTKPSHSQSKPSKKKPRKKSLSKKPQSKIDSLPDQRPIPSTSRFQSTLQKLKEKDKEEQRKMPVKIQTESPCIDAEKKQDLANTEPQPDVVTIQSSFSTPETTETETFSNKIFRHSAKEKQEQLTQFLFPIIAAIEKAAKTAVISNWMLYYNDRNIENNELKKRLLNLERGFKSLKDFICLFITKGQKFILTNFLTLMSEPFDETFMYREMIAWFHHSDIEKFLNAENAFRTAKHQNEKFNEVLYKCKTLEEIEAVFVGMEDGAIKTILSKIIFQLLKNPDSQITEEIDRSILDNSQKTLLPRLLEKIYNNVEKRKKLDKYADQLMEVYLFQSLSSPLNTSSEQSIDSYIALLIKCLRLIQVTFLSKKKHLSQQVFDLNFLYHRYEIREKIFTKLNFPGEDELFQLQLKIRQHIESPVIICFVKEEQLKIDCYHIFITSLESAKKIFEEKHGVLGQFNKEILDFEKKYKGKIYITPYGDSNYYFFRQSDFEYSWATRTLFSSSLPVITNPTILRKLFGKIHIEELTLFFTPNIFNPEMNQRWKELITHLAYSLFYPVFDGFFGSLHYNLLLASYPNRFKPFIMHFLNENTESIIDRLSSMYENKPASWADFITQLTAIFEEYTEIYNQNFKSLRKDWH